MARAIGRRTLRREGATMEPTDRPTDHPTDHPTELEDPVRRVLFYLFHDRDGIVDDYVPYKLRALRPFVDHVFVVSNSDLTPEGRAALDEVADTVLVRENTGWDVGAFTAAMATFGEARLAEYDELILMNSTFFAPVYPFAEVFDRMTAEPVDFWGISSHPEVDPNPFANTTGILERHLQTHWVTVRRRMFTSLEWRDFWATMPPLVTYDDVVLSYEARFTAYFEHAGFRLGRRLARGGLPHRARHLRERSAAARRPVPDRQAPPVLPRADVPGAQRDHRPPGPPGAGAHRLPPRAGVAQRRPRRRAPRALHELLAPGDAAGDGPRTDGETQGGPRVLGLAHVSDPQSMGPLLAALHHLPPGSDVVVTTPTRHVDEVTGALAPDPAGDRAGMRVDMRPVADDRGGHMAALLVEGRDLLEGGGYDLVCHVHTVRPPDDESNAAHLLEDHNLDNVLATGGYVRRVLQLFAEHPTLGMVFPPTVHIGFPTMGHGWGEHRLAALEVARETGMRTLFDPDTPLAPYGGMFWARPESLATLMSRPWQHADYADGHLAPAQELLLGYSALSAGWHVRCVMTLDWASVNYPFLEYKLQKVSSALPAHTQQQLEFIRELEAQDSILPVIRREVDRRYPRLGRSARPAYRVARDALDRLGGRRR